MHRLGLAFRKWIEFKMETDPFWKVRRGGEGAREGGREDEEEGRIGRGGRAVWNNQC
jgi:hypothetical protein